MGKLNLESNLLTEIHVATFQNLNRLESLNLKYNRIHYLTSKHFINSTSRLQILNIESNNLKALSLDYLFPSIEVKLAFNDLQQMEIAAKIKSLNLSSNLKLQKVFSTNLESLDLSNNKEIFQIDSQVFKELKYLIIANTTARLLNGINISLLAKLISLDLSHLAIEPGLIKQIEALPKLKELYLRNCSLRSTFNLALLQLEKVDLSQNLFIKLPDFDFLTGSSQTLYFLNLFNVNMDEIVELSRLSNLKYMNLGSNLLNKIKTTSFIKNSQIQSVNE
jgi:Leucine-rich repeat (LRR) protein